MKLKLNFGRHVYPMELTLNWRVYRQHVHGPFVKNERTTLPVAVRFVWCDPKEPSSAWNIWTYWPGGALCWHFHIDRRPYGWWMEEKLTKKLRELVTYYSAAEVREALREVTR